MTEIAIPAVPVGVLVLLNFLAPYATALVVQPQWETRYKKIVAVVVSLVLAAVVLVLSYVGFGEPVPAWPALLLLAVVVSQASYDLVLKKSADTLTVATSPARGEHSAE